MAITQEVERAISEIRANLPNSEVSIKEDGQGGAIVIVEQVDLGPKYKPQETWVGFQITFQYPMADVYPHFIRGDIVRTDGTAFGEGITKPHIWQEREATQVSRKSNHLNPTFDTAILKLHKVLKWLRSL